MWTKLLVFGALLFFLVPDLYAARCKVDGKWYSYDSPECSPIRTQAAESSKGPTDLKPEELARTINSAQEPSASSTISPNFDAPYMHPWPEVAYLAEKYCKEREKYMRFRECKVKEESSYWAMRGNFEMPEQVATESKELCTSKTSSFLDQAMCMQNESMGYDKFTSKSELPDQMAKEAREKCQDQFVSWSQRGSCLLSAVARFKNPNRNNRDRRTMAAAGALLASAPPGYSDISEVVTFRVRPEERPKRKVFGGPPPRPVPLDMRQRAARMAQDAADPIVLSQAIEVLESEARFTLLSPAQTEINGIGSLSFHWPASVSALHGVRLTEEDDSVVVLMLEVEVGRVYLIDFMVWGVLQGSYQLTIGSKHHTYEDIGPSLQHVTTRLIAEESGKVFLLLKHLNGKGFSFYSVAITDVSATGVFAAPNSSTTNLSQSESSGGR